MSVLAVSRAAKKRSPTGWETTFLFIAGRLWVIGKSYKNRHESLRELRQEFPAIFPARLHPNVFLNGLPPRQIGEIPVHLLLPCCRKWPHEGCEGHIWRLPTIHNRLNDLRCE